MEGSLSEGILRFNDVALSSVEAYVEALSKLYREDCGSSDWVVELKPLGGIHGRVEHAGTGLVITARRSWNGHREGQFPL
jgi:hypothetical protein